MSYQNMKFCWLLQHCVGEQHSRLLSWYSDCLVSIMELRSKERGLKFPLPMLLSESWYTYYLTSSSYISKKGNTVVKCKKTRTQFPPTTCSWREVVASTDVTGFILFNWSYFWFNEQNSDKLLGGYLRYWEKADICGLSWISGFSILGWGSYFT